MFMKSGLAWIAGTTARLNSFPKARIQKDASSVSRTSLKSLRAISTTCGQCPAGCGVIAYLNGDRLVQILGNPDHPNNKGGLCVRGIAGVNLANDPERLLYPLKRKGARGSGQWTRITWDEALSFLSRRIKDMLDSGRMSEFVLDKGYNDLLLERFASSLGLTSIIDRPALKFLSQSTALVSMVGSPSLIADVSRSRTIINFGSNPLANHDQFVGLALRIIQAKANQGARLITFDVRLSETAALSDAWYPVKSGTDGILALAMARIIMDKGLADRNFINQSTNFSFSDLKGHLSSYTPQRAEKESGVRASDIERLAITFATQKPSVAIFGGGLSEHENGTQNVRCVLLLNWLVGNLEKEGGLFFPRLPIIFEKEASDHSLRLRTGLAATVINDIIENQTRIDTYFAFQSNPAFDEPECSAVEKILKNEEKIPFLVAMDTHLTETAMMADVILPAATYLEGWGLSSAPSLDKLPVLNIRQPVLSLMSPAEVLRLPDFEAGKLLDPVFRPKGEAKEAGNICLELARRIGGNIADLFPFKDTKEYVSHLISTLSSLKSKNEFQTLKNKGYWVEPNRIKPFTAKNKVLTSISSEKFKRKSHHALPDYQPLSLAQKKEDNEFILTTFKSSLGSEETANSKWAREILHENLLWINKDAAARLGIKTGDKVRLTSSVGTLIVRALSTHRIHPRSVAIAEGFGHTAVGNVAKSRRFKSADRDTQLIWWDKNGVNPKRIMERRKDPLSGGLALKDTVVRIKRA